MLPVIDRSHLKLFVSRIAEGKTLVFSNEPLHVKINRLNHYPIRLHAPTTFQFCHVPIFVHFQSPFLLSLGVVMMNSRKTLVTGATGHLGANLVRRLLEDGNSLIVIEHNLDVIRASDWLIDLGPGGGREGGELIYAGPRPDIEAAPRSLTGAALKRWRSVVV